MACLYYVLRGVHTHIWFFPAHHSLSEPAMKTHLQAGLGGIFIKSLPEFLTHDLPGCVSISQLFYKCVFIFCLGVASPAAWGPDLGEYVWSWLGVLAILLHSENAFRVRSDADWCVAWLLARGRLRGWKSGALGWWWTLRRVARRLCHAMLEATWVRSVQVGRIGSWRLGEITREWCRDTETQWGWEGIIEAILVFLCVVALWVVTDCWAGTKRAIRKTDWRQETVWS